MIEVLIASALLAVAAGYIASSILNSKRMFKTSTYQYVALNLARDIIEFGGSVRYGTAFKLRYYHPPAESCSVCRGSCYSGSIATRGYGLKEYSCFNPRNIHAFTDLGDIKARGLVPPGNPDSVVILYETKKDPNFYGADVHHVNVSWEEDGIRHSRDLSTISIAQTNDQLHLELSQFTWRAK